MILINAHCDRTLAEAIDLQSAVVEAHQVWHKLGEPRIRRSLVQKLAFVSALQVQLHHFLYLERTEFRCHGIRCSFHSAHRAVAGPIRS